MIDVRTECENLGYLNYDDCPDSVKMETLQKWIDRLGAIGTTISTDRCDSFVNQYGDGTWVYRLEFRDLIVKNDLFENQLMVVTGKITETGTTHEADFKTYGLFFLSKIL